MATHEQKDLKSRSRSAEEPHRTSEPQGNLARGDAGRRLARRDEFWDMSADPFRTMRRFFDQFDRWPFSPGFGLFGSQGGRGALQSFWSPQIETIQRGDQFVIRADLPGLDRKDVSVEVQDDALVIEGERKEEQERDEEGYYSSERSYGHFRRVVPLPEGAIVDSVKASFRNGVLEVVMQAPPHEVSRGRRIEIADKAQGD